MEVLKGLAEGDRIVVNPTDDLTEGLAVQANPYDKGGHDANAQGGQQGNQKSGPGKDGSGEQNEPNSHPE
jgi:hypothetical protein